ncbi:MAG: winged helix-turn-helix domain-containing protein [Verrucomicrobiales bacterium]
MLTRQERALLGFFPANSGRALTRETLLRAMPRRTLLTSERTVDQAIKKKGHYNHEIH